jgi:hypothetical protein
MSAREKYRNCIELLQGTLDNVDLAKLAVVGALAGVLNPIRNGN